MMLHYGAPPDFPRRSPRVVPDVPGVAGVVRMEDLARQLRELREAFDALRAGKGESTPLAMVRRVAEALIAGDPLALSELEKVCAEARDKEG